MPTLQIYGGIVSALRYLLLILEIASSLGDLLAGDLLTDLSKKLWLGILWWVGDKLNAGIYGRGFSDFSHACVYFRRAPNTMSAFVSFISISFFFLILQKSNI